MAREIKFNATMDFGTFAEREYDRYDWKTKEKTHVKQELKVQLGHWSSDDGKDKEHIDKIDIRPWNDDDTCDKGITLTPEEFQSMYEMMTDVLQKMQGEN